MDENLNELIKKYENSMPSMMEYKNAAEFSGTESKRVDGMIKEVTDSWNKIDKEMRSIWGSYAGLLAKVKNIVNPMSKEEILKEIKKKLSENISKCNQLYKVVESEYNKMEKESKFLEDYMEEKYEELEKVKADATKMYLEYSKLLNSNKDQKSYYFRRLEKALFNNLSKLDSLMFQIQHLRQSYDYIYFNQLVLQKYSVALNNTSTTLQTALSNLETLYMSFDLRNFHEVIKDSYDFTSKLRELEGKMMNVKNKEVEVTNQVVREAENSSKVMEDVVKRFDEQNRLMERLYNSPNIAEFLKSLEERGLNVEENRDEEKENRLRS
ncbi:MAG: hypothetical protein QXD62_03435 [Candidatus Woesearchaeota archaeon]